MSQVHPKFSHQVAKFSVDVAGCQRAMCDWLEARGVDCLLVTSQDMFLSEYNVLANSQRYALSGFTGSTGDGVFVSRRLTASLSLPAHFVLFVDGRYHLQADRECRPELVQVVKMGTLGALAESPQQWIEKLTCVDLTCAVDGSRLAWKRFRELRDLCRQRNWKLEVFGGSEISEQLFLPGWRMNRPIRPLPFTAAGRSVQANIQALHQRLPKGLVPSDACIITCASDDAAWLLNARGFHMPFSSAVLAWCFLVGSDLVVFLPEGIHESHVDVNSSQDGINIHVIRADFKALAYTLTNLVQAKAILFSGNSVNAWLVDFAARLWPSATLIEDFDALVKLRASKTPQELEALKSAFMKSSRAIARTLRWVKECVNLPAGAKSSDPEFSAAISEADLARKIEKEYLAEGAVEHAFSPIAATGENGAIVHYGGASPDVLVRDGDLVLLDSGAYYSEGFATDCTRVVYAGKKGSQPHKWQKEIYTVTLKAFIAGMTAEFSRADSGAAVDTIVRSVSRAKNYEYGHGTGHGLGIHVHEDGHRISATSLVPMVENGVVSVEPGIYLTGQGGVRIENCVIVRAHDSKPDCFRFENMLWVGMDWDLIDLNLIDPRERVWLDEYERRCRELGTQISDTNLPA